MKRVLLCVLSGGLIFILTCAPAWAQATAQISGIVRDSSGGVLPGVDITATQTDTGLARTTVTNESGAYVLPNLPLGPYRLDATLSGFRSYGQTGIVLQVNSSPVINPIMELGALSETVDVRADTTLVETRNSTVGAVMTNERILELPLNGRDVSELIMLAGGAVMTSAGRGEGLVGAASPQISVAGGAGFGVDYTLDGANHVSFVTGSTMLMPFPDAMQEFKVETSGVTAQRGSSTAVAAVTKSGTNAFHGALFEFLRNDLFNAKPYFAAVNRVTGEKVGSTLKRNQFGGTLGGPIFRNKLFFFGAYQGTTLRQDPANLQAFVPTAAMLAGDWTAFASPECNNGRQLALRAPFVNNRINPALYSGPALAIVRYQGATPFPTATNPCGEITYGRRTATGEGQYVGKIDYQATTSHSLFGRAFVQNFSSQDPRKFNTNLLQDTGWRESRQASYTGGSTYVFNSSTVQSLRLAGNSTTNRYRNVEPGELFNWCDIGVNVYCAPEITRVKNMVVNGGFDLTSDHLSGMHYKGESYSGNYDLTLVRGAHQLSVGANAVHSNQDNFSIWASVHQFRFTGAATGSGLGDFLLGRPTTFFTGASSPHLVSGTTVAVYGADTWQMRNVTLTYGLRWEPYLPQAPEAIFNFDAERFRQGIRSSVFANAPAGIFYRGDPGFPKDGVNPRWLQFAPRAGLAWDVSGDGRTSVRASYARAYVYVPGDFREQYSGASPWGARMTLASPVGGLEDPWRGVPGGNIFPYQLNREAPFVSSGVYYTQPYDLRNPSNHSWNLNFQRQLLPRLFASASYMGNALVNVWSNKPLNPSIYFPGVASATGQCVAQGYALSTAPGTPCSTLANTNARRRLTLENPVEGPKLGFVAEADDEGTQNYQGMLLSIEARPTTAVSVQGNYTLSRCVGPYATLYDAMAQPASDTWTDPGNRDFDRGACDSDRRHVLNMTAVAETPQFARPMVRMVASGWRLAGIYSRATGSPLTIFAGSDRALNGLGVNATGGATQRADQVLPDPYGNRAAGPLSSYLNPAAFALPALGTLGNSARNSLRGPSTWSLDMALSRVFKVTDSHRLEFRTEAFNLTNSFRPGNPDTTLTNANFGVIRTALPARILQFALKYVF